MRFEPVRKARQAADLPVAAIAQAAGKSIGWVYSVERGLTAPSREDAERVATLLGRPADALFGRIREGEQAANK